MTIPNMPIVVIMSAELTGNPLNESRTATLRRELASTNLQFEQARGCYAGVQEQSFVIVLDRPEQVEYLLDLAHEYGQESILLRNADGTVEFVNVRARSGVRARGTLQQITPGMAEQMLAWTYLKGTYYAVV